MAWRRPTGRASATSSGRWSSGWKSHVTRSMSCFGSTHIRVITILKKKVCNFVGGEPSPPCEPNIQPAYDGAHKPKIFGRPRQHARRQPDRSQLCHAFLLARVRSPEDALHQLQRTYPLHVGLITAVNGAL